MSNDSKLMKIFKFLFLQIVMTCSVNHVCAYGFKVDGIFYNVLPNGNSVSVTYGPEGNNNYIGQVEIPSIVSFDGKEYKVTSIGENAFENSSDLKSVIIPNSVTAIEDKAFYNSGIISVTIGSGVTYMGNSAFGNCNDLYKVSLLPNSVPSGLSEAFSRLTGRVTYVANGNYSDKSLGSIQEYKYLSSAFVVDGVKYVPVSPSNRTCDVIDYDYGAISPTLKITSNVKNQGIEMTVQNIGPRSFYKVISLAEITISNSGHIGGCAFYQCDGIKTVDISNTGNIEDNAFSYCKKITDVKISNVGNIGSYAFYECDEIQTIDISNAGDIGRVAFSRCKSLKTVKIGCSGSIGENAFSNCPNLQKIDMEPGISEIKMGCFWEDHKLEYVKLSPTVKILHPYVFYGCTTLSDIELPPSVKSIGNNAFDSCTSLTDITLPPSVEEVGDCAFKSCPSLLKVTFVDGDKEILLGNNGENNGLFADCPITDVYVGRNLLYDTRAECGFSPFYGSKTLKRVTVSDSPKAVFENEFYGCVALTDVQLGNGVKKIGNYAFSGCCSIETVVLGESLSVIGNEAFSDCTAMTTLVTEALTPPTCGNQALDDINKWTCKIYVPEKAIDEYKNTSQWKDFFFYEPLYVTGHKLYIQLAESIVSVKIDSSTRITFPDETLTLNYDGAITRWSFDDFVKWYFRRIYSTEPLGIKDIEVDISNISIIIIGNTLSISAGNEVDVMVCDITGNILVTAIGTVEIDMSYYPSGVYIVKSGNKSVKFIKK